ncbi:serine protease Do [Azonexus fungiphilus]|uniref:Probable periplasmic serine endoprotease DegP-like n=1 Tax=Azonexus fungiphilus TaxID=146940 RepID=A0A495VT18_9RHOO|nr:DegQ family serine endoprotease [Azonexus fungiphilus]RKT50818.1 serine protease Do [Azonexus fungiphilus]
MPLNRLKLTVAALAVSAAVGGAYALGQHPSGNAPAPAAAPVAVATPVAAPAPAGFPDLRSIVAANAPAVVNIAVTANRKATYGGPQIDPSDPFFKFFRQFRGLIPEDAEPSRGVGSGFIVSADGTILTNAHVVADADEVIVKLNDKREYTAKILGLDQASDVAVLKIEARNLPTVRIGNSKSAQVGEWVLAIGSPYGFESSASAGIISAKSRSLPDGSYVPFLQTDVAVNPGNSGGPLFNLQGEVIGINSQIYSRSGGYQGLSFAIPIEVAMNVERQIVAHGKVERGRLGVAIQEVNQSLADSFGLPRPAGALVSSVDKDGPAARAGLEAGDVILGIDGQPVNASGELPAVVAAKRPGETVRLQVWRNKAMRDIVVKVGAFQEARSAAAETPSADKGRLGVAVRPLTPEESRRRGIAGGLVVEQVGGAAARAGIRPGDLILSVNGEAVGDIDKLRAAIGKSGKKAALLVERDNARLFVPVDLG